MDAARDAPGAALLHIYDDALPQVYGYVLRRCGHVATAEELTSETFLAAAVACRRPDATEVDVRWLIGVARHKLADHWRREAREQRSLRAVADDPTRPEVEDPWDAAIDASRAHETLQRLGPHHRLALTLRYVDDLPVSEVAALLGRTVLATEALLVRAKRAFRTIYSEGGETP